MPLFTIAQNNSTSDIDSIAGRLIKNLRSNTKEKILLQTDLETSVYPAGDYGDLSERF